MKINEVLHANNFGEKGQDVLIDITFEDEREKKYNTESSFVSVWLDSEEGTSVTMCKDGVYTDLDLFTQEEQEKLIQCANEYVSLF